MDEVQREIDALDAAIFSGDLLESVEHRAQLREHLERWARALKAREAGAEGLL